MLDYMEVEYLCRRRSVTKSQILSKAFSSATRMSRLIILCRRRIESRVLYRLACYVRFPFGFCMHPSEVYLSSVGAKLFILPQCQLQYATTAGQDSQHQSSHHTTYGSKETAHIRRCVGIARKHMRLKNHKPIKTADRKNS